MTKILIVDDDPMILESTRLYLENHGFDTICAGNGQEALECAKKGKINLALVDIFMPKQGGFEFIMALKNSFPIIAMSGVTSHRFKPLAFAENLGAAATLSKPFEPRELLQTISNVMEHKNL